MFAILILEREPLKIEELPAAMQSWLTAAGSFAFLALALWAVFYVVRLAFPVTSGGEKRLSPLTWLGGSALGALILTLLPIGLNALWVSAGISAPSTTSFKNPNLPQWEQKWLGSMGRYLPPWFERAETTGKKPEDITKAPENVNRVLGVTYGTAFCLMAVALPILVHLSRLRWRRIWALARLSMKEALRRRVLWSFSALLLVFLFAAWFLPHKPEDQVRSYVRVVYWAMSPLLLVTAGLLAAFSIPGDLKNQAIHTIVTKPVERFEIVLGRFLGYTLLMSAVLVVMTAVSLIYVERGVDPDAAEESLKARVPIFGDLTVVNGKSVGREWEYRNYISGGDRSDWVVWAFPKISKNLAQRDRVRCEFGFDIFRTTKGQENRGVFCSFLFGTWTPYKEGDKEAEEKWIDQVVTRPHFNEAVLQKYRQEREQEKSKPTPDPDDVIDGRLAEKYGLYEVRSKEVVDYHTLSVDIPGALFKEMQKAETERRKSRRVAPFFIQLSCDSATQYLGVAKHDLYLLDDEQWFETNFFKGAAGLWFRLCLVIGLAVTWSTYVSGVISFLATFFFYITGIFLDYLQELAAGKTIGGGPMESFIRLARNENMVKQLEQTPTLKVANIVDQVFSWVLARIINVFPDVERYDLTGYVSQGFNISTSQLLVDNFVPLAGYLVVWAVGAYYLMRWREIAS